MKQTSPKRIQEQTWKGEINDPLRVVQETEISQH